MTQASQQGQIGTSQSTRLETGKGTLFGVPLGNLGWFASLLIGLGLGLMAFFAATFVGIISILIYSSQTHQPANFALSYRWGGLTAGILVLLAAWSYLGTQWVRRIFRKE